jgi:ligand-binding sensor domain-containing protein
MKNALILLFCLLTGKVLYAQSFTASHSPSLQTITQGDTTGFNVTINPVGGFNASVYFQLTLPNCLNTCVNLSTASANSPYLGVRIKVTAASSAVPPGLYQIILKSYNGMIVEYDTCLLKINATLNSQWRTYTTANSPLTVNNAICTAIDRSGNFWVGSRQGVGTGPGALLCLDQNQWNVWKTYGHSVVDLCGTTVSTSTASIANNGINSICTQGDTVFACSNSEIYRVINKVLIKIPIPVINSPEEFHTLRMDPQNNLWASTYYGLYKYNGSSWTTFNFTGAPCGSSPSIQDFDFDNNGNLWLAAAGIHKHDGSFWTSYGNASGLLGASFSALAKSGNGTIWVGSYNNATVFKHNGTTNAFTPYAYSAASSGAVFSITFDTNNNPIVGSDGGLFLYNGSSWTQQGSPVQVNTGQTVVSIPWMASMDQNNNLIVANGSAGFHVRGFPAAPVSIQRQEAAMDVLTVFPNPTSGRVNIPGAAGENFRLFVYNLNGQMVFSGTTMDGAADLSLPEGMYFMKIVDGSQRSVSKKICVTR